MTWDDLYNFLGAKSFIYYISSSQIQDMLWPVKIVFIFASLFFFVFIVYFMLNSSWLQYKFLEDITEFFSWQAYGQRELQKRINSIRKKTESGVESDLKLAIIDADDLLTRVLDERGYDGEGFDDMIKKASRMIAPIYDDVLRAHEARNAVVHNPGYKLSADQAKKILDTYEAATKSIGL